MKTEYNYDFAYEDESTIFGFFGEHRKLSNFYPCKFDYKGFEFPSSEHAYMISKVGDEIDPVVYDEIVSMTCGQVKKWGSMVKLRPDWESVKDSVMFDILLCKFTKDKNRTMWGGPTLLRYLKYSTKDKELIEANNWGDKYWGVDSETKEGKNMLGKTLMRVRDYINLGYEY